MSRLIQITALLTLGVWGLATLHCRLETVPGLAFLQSCCSADSTGAVPQGCEGDDCGPVEEGQYSLQSYTPLIPQPDAVLIAGLPRLSEVLPRAQSKAFLLSESPPPRPRVWRFAQRTALPPRAPSLAS